MNMTTVPSDQLKAMQHEIADLNEQVAQLEFSWAGCSQQLKDACKDLDEAEETIAQQAEHIVELNKECNSHYETCQQQAEAIRVAAELMHEVENKYFSMLKEKDIEAEKLKAEGDMYGWNFHVGMRSGATETHLTMTKLIKALAIQPSPDILQARDEKVAEAIAKMTDEVCSLLQTADKSDDYVAGVGNAVTSVEESIERGEWRKYL